MNMLPNSRTGTKTPFELFYHKRPALHKSHPFVSFGQCAIIPMGDAKRQTLADSNGYPFSATDRAELGVCVGLDPLFPGQYLFYQANGTVVPRRLLKIVNTIPFDWPTRRVVLPAMLDGKLVQVKERALRRVLR